MGIVADAVGKTLAVEADTLVDVVGNIELVVVLHMQVGPECKTSDVWLMLVNYLLIFAFFCKYFSRLFDITIF